VGKVGGTAGGLITGLVRPAVFIVLLVWVLSKPEIGDSVSKKSVA
jgi:hypothetical protein